VILIIALTGAAPVLTAVKLAIDVPVPVPAKPMEVALLVQLKAVPTVALVSEIAVVALPLHSTWAGTASTTGVGLTVISKLMGLPVQVTPAFVNLGVTIIVAVIGLEVVLVAVKESVPAPLAARPIEVLEFVHSNTVPATKPLKGKFTVVPEQAV
jgi:hypothetical protein